MKLVECGYRSVFLVLVIQHAYGEVIDFRGGANGGLFGQNGGGEVDLSTGDNAAGAGQAGYPGENNGYLPPIGSDSSDLNAAFAGLPPKKVENEGSENLGPAITAPTARQVGCAAAMKCVEERFCTMTGMISKTAVDLTPDQRLRAVPMVDCKNPDDGVIGKCCRDPDYTDPWPAGDFPANYKGAFDEQGFPVIWNISRINRPTRPIQSVPVPIRQSVRPQPQQPSRFPSTARPTPVPEQPAQFPGGGFPDQEGPKEVLTNFISQPPVPAVQQPVTPFPQQFSSVTPSPSRRPQINVTPFSPTQRPQGAINVTPFTQQPKQQFQVIVNNIEEQPVPQLPSSSFSRPQVVPRPEEKFQFEQPQPQRPEFVESVKFGQPALPAGPIQQAQPQQPPKTFGLQNIPNQINNFFNPPQQGEIVEAPQADVPEATEKPTSIFGNFPQNIIPAFPTIPQIPQIPAIPSIPSFPSSSGKEIAPTSVQIESHQPGYQCGIINQVTYNGKLNPHEVPFGEIPWMVMILDNRQSKPICSGALVAPDRVVTAAHCVDSLKESDVSIKVGEWKLGYDLRHEEPYPTEIVQVKSIIAHPAYHSESASHDMVVLLLQRPVKLDQHVDTICVSESVQVTSQRKCISVGWGKYPMSIHAAGAIMNKIEVSPLNEFECNQRIRNAESPIELDDSLVCVKAIDQSANMCMVDGGSPLACEREDGSYEIIGVYSTETGCQPTNQVATFAKIDAQWVNNVNTPAVQVFQQQPQPVEKNNYINYPGSLPSGINEYLPPSV